MTSTYGVLRGLRGYFSKSLHVRARPRTRRSASFQYRRSLKITPRNPVNPATGEDDAATKASWEAGGDGAAHLHPLPAGHVRSVLARRLRLVDNRRLERLGALQGMLDGIVQDARSPAWPATAQVAAAHVGHRSARDGPRRVVPTALACRPTPASGGTWGQRRGGAKVAEKQGGNGSSLATLGRRWPRERQPISTDFLS